MAKSEIVIYKSEDSSIKADVLSLTESSCEVIMYMAGASETLRIKCVKN